MPPSRWIWMLLLSALLPTAAAGQERDAVPVQTRWETFTTEWRADAWLEKSQFRPLGYMRGEEDESWQARFLALQAAVANPRESLPILLAALKSENVAERILAAQTLGYLDAEVPTEPLLAAARSDADAAVRLYAIDSLGMLGKEVDWAALRKNETDRDAGKHIAYAIERNRAPLDPAIRRSLVEYDAGRLDTAKVGEAAPHFELTAVTGETIRLDSFRDKRAVVLVFVYGDT